MQVTQKTVGDFDSAYSTPADACTQERTLRRGW